MKPLLLFILLLITTVSFCQVSPADKPKLIEKENKMKPFAIAMLHSISPEERIMADSVFTKEFVQALKTKNSFYYPFDSIITVSRLYPPDSSFRIFTWQLVMNEYVTRQHGAIQMRTNDGSLKLYPLIDKSDITSNMTDTTGDNYGWIGAVYYKIIQKQSGGKPVYTLLGYDENNLRSTKKIIEQLEFRDGKPWFGGNFRVQDDLKAKSLARFIMEYKKDASPRLTFDTDLDMIVYEHLVSETNEPQKKWTLVGDGDYEGFKWNNGRWNYISKVFSEVTPEGKEPVPLPIRDAQGNIDETKLAGYEEDAPPAPAKQKTSKEKKKN